MPDLHLFDNFTAGWSTNAINSTTQYATPFKTAQDGFIVALRWYRTGVGTLYAAEALSLWDTTDQSRKAHVTSLTDSGAQGWQETVLAVPFQPVLNREYRVCVSVPSNHYQAYYTLGTSPTTPYPLSFGATKRANTVGVDGIYPSSTDNTYHQGVDVAFNLSGSGSTPVTTGYLDPALAQVVSDLESYIDSQNAQILSMVSNESTPSQYSIPQQTLDEVQDASTGLAAIKGVVDTIATSVGSALETAVSNVASDVSDIVTSVGADLVGAVTAGFATTAQLASDWANWAGAFTTGWTDWLAGAAQSWADLWTRLLTGGGALPPQVAVPGTGWAQVATTAFTDDIAWAQPADLYVVTFLDTGANDTTTLVSGVDVVYRLAWWLPINGTETVGQRRFIDTPSIELTDGGARMPGILLHCPRGGAGTIDAWQYTP